MRESERESKRARKVERRQKYSDRDREEKFMSSFLINILRI